MSDPLLQQLKMYAAQQPTSVAYAEVEQGRLLRKLTWLELLHSAEAFAHQVSMDRAEPTAILCMPNCLEYVIAYLGTLLAGGVVFPMPAASTAFEIAQAIDAAGVDVVVADAARLRDIGTTCDTIARCDIELQPAVAAIKGATVCARQPGAMLLQSSGTTGMPKIVRRELAALIADGANCARAVQLRRDDAMLAAVPMSHSYAIDHVVLGAVVAGCRVDICSQFLPGPVMESICERCVTVLPLVPFMIDMLSAEAAGRSKPLQHRLRRVYSAGGQLPEASARLFESYFSVRIGQIYGSTEVASVTYNDPAVEPFCVTAVGRPMDGVEIRILDADAPDANCPLETGREGHVAIRAPSMLSGYVNASESPFVDGFFLSGDLGRLGETGCLTITGRIKLLIDVGGQKVNPVEVEAVLRQHPAVGDVVVLPVAITPTLQRIKAVIEWKDEPADIDELRQLARSRLSPHKVPRYFETVASLPRSAAGKVLRQAVAP